MLIDRGYREPQVFLKLKTLLEPVGITRYYTDSWGASTRPLEADAPNQASATRRRASGSP